MTGPGGDGGVASASAQWRRRRPEPSPTQRALALLTRREHSRRELLRKLEQRGVQPEDADAVVGKLADAGWQDDARFAESLVRSRAQSGYGPAWIRAELGTHGLREDEVAVALEGGEQDWADIAAMLVRKRYGEAGPGGIEQRRKAMDLLLRRGFGFDHAQAALSALAAGGDGQ